MTETVASAPLETPRDSRRAPALWLLLALIVIGFFTAFAFYPGLFFVIGVNHYGVWFLDTFALLASNDAVTRGLDPYAPNPLDYFNRPHVYSHWWLHLRDLGLTRADVVRLGLGTVGAFLIAALARLRPRQWGELLWYVSVFCTAPILLAVDRANNDLVIFVLLAPVVACVRSKRPGVWLLGLLLVAVAAILKYYPAIAVVVLLRGDDRRELRIRLVVIALVLAIAGLTVMRDLQGYGLVAPKPEGLLSFGAAAFFAEQGWTGWMPKLLCVLAGGGVVVLAWRRRWLRDWVPSAAQESNWLHFILGAALLTGCFFASLNFGYRWIFALWLAPMLWSLLRDSRTPPPVQRLTRWTIGLLLAVLWWDPFCCFILNRFIGVLSGPTIMHLASGCFIAEQPLDWSLFVAFLIFLTHYAQDRVRIIRGC